MNRFEQELSSLRDQNLLRETETRPGTGGQLQSPDGPLLNFSSNDYLDLAGNQHVRKKARDYVEEYGAGATASRLVVGTLPCHEELERRIADLKGYPVALVLGSGYLTNVGVIPALVGRNDYVVADRLAHASMVDGVLQSRASLKRFRHNDLNHLEERLNSIPADSNVLVLTESVFSMDGDLAPLEGIAELARSFEATLLVDEAHATGVYGQQGAGLVQERGLEDEVDVSMATLSKALGGYGGAVACSKRLRSYFVNKARSFIYSTALPPASVGASIGALEVLEQNPELGDELLDRAFFLREQFRKRGLNTGSSNSQIVPVIVGDNKPTLELAEQLEEAGILAVAIRPPTVPKGEARIRFSVTLAHTRKQLERTAEKVEEFAKNTGVLP